MCQTMASVCSLYCVLNPLPLCHISYLSLAFYLVMSVTKNTEHCLYTDEYQYKAVGGTQQQQ